MPDFSFGVVGQMDDVYFGLALHHLTQPDQSVITGDQLGRLPLKMTLHAGAKGHDFHRGLLSREFTLSPNLVYQQQGSFRQINAGLYMKEDWLTFGLWYRNNLSIRPNSIVAMVGYQTEKFQLGYSFDYSLSNTSVYSYGSHEISMIFYFGEAHRSRFFRTMEIPQMQGINRSALPYQSVGVFHPGNHCNSAPRDRCLPGQKSHLSYVRPIL